MTRNQKSGINTPFLINEIPDPLAPKQSVGRSRLNSECHKEEDNYICSRKFCSFCLKT